MTILPGSTLGVLGSGQLGRMFAIEARKMGYRVATFAIGKPGAINAALCAVAILSNSRPDLRKRLKQFREEQAKKVQDENL